MHEDIPKLNKNQFGVVVKVIHFDKTPPTDEVLYFTVNNSSLSVELYPQKPIIIIDKDIAKSIINKIAEIDDITRANKNDRQ